MELVCRALNAVASSADKQVILVAKCGKEFRFNTNMAKSCSSYFVATLENGMKEAGK